MWMLACRWGSVYRSTYLSTGFDKTECRLCWRPNWYAAALSLPAPSPHTGSNISDPDLLPVSSSAISCCVLTQNWTLCECEGWRSRTRLVWGTERERSRESEAGWSCQSCLLAIGCCCLTHWCERWECCCCCAATMADICCQQIAWKSEIFQDFNLCVDYDIRIWAL